MEEKINRSLRLASLAVDQLRKAKNVSFIREVSEALSEAYKKGNKVIIAGNGGSLCDASHFAEELTGQFCKPRRALEAVVLNDPGFITCTANDFGYETVFARGVEAHGKSGDIFIGLTTSGNSPNLIRAFEAARANDLKTVAFLGKGGGRLKGTADYEMIIEGFSTSDRIQEAHMTALHIIVEMIEQELFYREGALFSAASDCPELHETR